MSTCHQIRTTTINDLPNEILFDIFVYFWATDLFHSFSLVFPHLLSDRFLRLYVRLTSYTNENRFINSILPLIQPEQIVSLSLISLSSTFPVDRLINLQSFSLEYGSSTNYNESYQQIFEKLSRLPQLKNLSAEFNRNDLMYRNEIIRLIFEKLSLHRFDFRSYDGETTKLTSTFNSSIIEHISLRGIKELNIMISLLQCTPNVRTVRLIDIKFRGYSYGNIVLPHVNRLILSNCDVFPFENLSEFIKNVVPNISKLKLHDDFCGKYVENCLESNNWDCLLQLRKRKLKKIKLDIQCQSYDSIYFLMCTGNFAGDPYFYEKVFRLEYLPNGKVRLTASFDL
jgi:hypothetical protein